MHLSGKRFYVGLFSTVEEALQAQSEKRQHLVDAASRDPDGKIEVATRTTGEDEMVKVKAASATGSSLDKVCSEDFQDLPVEFSGGGVPRTATY